MPIPKICAILVLFTLAFAASAVAQVPDKATIEHELATIYSTKAAQPKLDNLTEEGRSLVPLMLEQGRYLYTELKPWVKDPEARLLTDGNHGEHGIRPNTHTVFSLAAMHRCLDAKEFPEEWTRDQCRDGAIGMLRFILPTHNAGGATCSDDKPWYNQWQSAHWANSAGRAAWLMWDELEPEMQWLAARMVCDEADRFVGVRPPAQVKSDTKAEENAWNSTVIALAYNMFPNHPNHELYRETAIRWAISSFVRQQDLTENPTIDGRSLKDWDVGATLHDDYTLENHNRVHPDYMHTIAQLHFQFLEYAWGGNPAPEALLFNTRHVYGRLKLFGFPDGNHIYPSGQDWRLHRNTDWIESHLPFAIFDQDAQAMRLFLHSRDAFARMLARKTGQGAYYLWEDDFASTEMMALERGLVMPFLLNGQLGGGPEPMPEEQLWKEIAGAHLFHAGKFAVYRTEKSISTFSWGQQVMGLVFPIQQDLLMNPFERAMIGIIEAPGVKDSPQVKELHAAPQGNDLAICGLLLRAGGAVEQRFAFVALANDRTLYMERLSLVDKSTSATALLATLPILNDSDWVYHDGSRTIMHADGNIELAAKPSDLLPLTLMSNWFNIDDEMGIVVLRRTGETSLHPKPHPAKRRTQQLLHLNGAILDAETPTAETIAVFLPASNAAATAAAAQSMHLAESEVGMKITLSDDTGVLVNLESLAINIEYHN